MEMTFIMCTRQVCADAYEHSFYMYPGCASGNTKYEQIIFNGESNISVWYVPANYELGVVPMSWADPSVVQYGLNSPATGEYTVTQVAGKQFSFRQGRGVTSDFLHYSLTDGKPKKTEDLLWVPFQRTAVNTIMKGSRHIEGNFMLFILM